MCSKILFITGGAGFIGSNFINKLFENSHEYKVINFDALYYCADQNNVEEHIRNSDNYEFINGNLQSYDLLKYIFETNSITHIIHFAAQSHVQTSFTDSIQYTKDNVLGTHNLLEVARLYCPKLERFVHCSTDEVYGESMLDIDEKHKTEQSVLCPTNPYAASKAAAEMLVQSYHHSFNMPIIITRGNNVYGPNQYPEKVIPRFIKQLKNGEKVTIQGNGSCIRAFLHAYDTANAFITVLEKGKIGEIYNIGCDEGMEYSILDVAKILIKYIHNTEEYDKWITYIEDRPFNDKRYYISNEKLKQLGWYIEINFHNGLQEIINKNYRLLENIFFKAYSKKYNYLIIFNPKSGCSTFRKMFLNLHEDELLVHPTDGYHSLQDHFKLPSDVNINNLNKIILCRNPYTRVVSMFTNRYCNKIENKRELYSLFNLKENTFTEFVNHLNYLKKNNLLNITNCHISEQIYYNDKNTYTIKL